MKAVQYQRLSIKELGGKLTTSQGAGCAEGSLSEEGQQNLVTSSETSKWEEGFRLGIRSYKDSLLHVHTSQALCPKRQSTVK